MNNSTDDLSFVQRAFRGDRLPVLLQSEAAECGLTCLAMIANYYGYATTLSELRRRFSTSLKGATLKSLMNVADAMGLSARPVRLEVDELADLKAPAILHWDLRHFVVMKKVSGRAVLIHDPALGERSVPVENIGRHFTGVALELLPTPSFELKPKAERVRLSDLFSGSRGLAPTIAQLFVLAVVLQAFSLLSPILNQTIIDDVLGQSDTELLTTIAAGMIVLLLINISVTRLRDYVALYMNTQLSYQMQSNLLRHILRLPVSWFEKRHVGDIISRFNSLGPAQSAITDSLPSILIDTIMCTFGLGMMFLYAPLLSGLEVATVIVFFSFRLLTFPYYRRRSVEGLHLNAKVQSTFMETMRGARTFKAFGKERERIAVWKNEQAAAINNSVRVARFNLWGGVGTGIVSGMQQIIGWYIGAKMVIEGQLTIGMLMAYQSYTSQFTGSANRLVSQFFTLQALGIHLERLSEIVHAEPEPNNEASHFNSIELCGRIELRALSFRYAEQEPWVLRDLDLKIEPGEFVCLVGPSGQGKTTLMKLMLGFYELTTGDILIDDVPLKSLGMGNYRDSIGVVLQDDQLFAGTIVDNIAFFDGDVDMERVEQAAKDAQVHADIMGLPMGYMSLVGDMGSFLSGGQRQRMFLARALYRKPKMLFLDEGTANLDPESERRVMETLNSLPITRIVIAHREAAVSGADRVIAVRDGQLIETVGGVGANVKSPPVE